MSLQEILEKDRERLIASLRQAGTPERATAVVESEYDRLLYEYNEHCETDYERRCAAMILQTARMTSPIMDCVGDTKIWEAGGKLISEEKKNVRLPAILLMAGGICLAVVSIAVLAGPEETLNRVFEAPAIAVAFAAGLVCLFFSGLLFYRTKKASYSDRQLKAENRVDAEKLYRTLHAVMLVADRNINDAAADKRIEETQKEKQASSAGSSSDLSLYSDLLEALNAKDGEYALDQISKVPFYLHQKGIEMMDYSDEYRSYFDVIPGEKRETIRPALLKNGQLLKKGIVSGDWV